MKKLGIILLITVMVLAAIAPMSFVSAASSIKVTYKCAETNVSTNQMRPYIQVQNTGTTAINLADIKVRYWYTKEGTASETFTVDYAQIGVAKVTGTFGSGYVEYGFTSAAGTLAAGASTGEIQVRLNKSDWSNYDQSNDYSFNSTITNYAENTKVTGYISGVLVYGVQPAGTSTTTPVPTLTPTPTPTAPPTSTPNPNQTATPTPTATPATTPLPANSDDWLHVVGNKVVDINGNPVWLTGANWFGYNTGTNVFDGVWSANMKQALDEMANRGINFLRLPISAELIDQWSKGTYPTPNINTYVNPELVGKNSLEVFDIAMQDCKANGMKVMLDIHSAKTNAAGHYYPVWYDGTITTEVWMKACEWITNRYKNDDTILAFDLKNEPHGKAYSETLFAKWDNSTDEFNWKNAAQTCANRILAINPNMLIMVEGIETYPKPGKAWTSKTEADYYGTWWGGNLRGVKDYPLNLGANQDQLVYSPHDYGPSVYRQSWFYTGFNKTTLYNDCWRDNWAYIMDQGIAPLLIGEWGGFMDGGDNQKWMEYLRDYIKEEHIHHTFWCYNANSGDTGGLVSNDFITWDEVKYGMLKSALWQDTNGKFVGLDHVKGLGATGLTVNQYYQNGGVAPVPTH